MGGSAIMAKVRPYIGTTTSWFVGQAAHIGKLLVYCGLMLLFSALLYWRGEQVAYGFRYFATRLAAKRGDAAVLLAGVPCAPWRWAWWSRPSLRRYWAGLALPSPACPTRLC